MKILKRSLLVLSKFALIVFGFIESSAIIEVTKLIFYITCLPVKDCKSFHPQTMLTIRFSFMSQAPYVRFFFPKKLFCQVVSFIPFIKQYSHRMKLLHSVVFLLLTNQLNYKQVMSHLSQKSCCLYFSLKLNFSFQTMVAQLGSFIHFQNVIIFQSGATDEFFV